MPEKKMIPVARPLFGDDEVRFVTDAVTAGDISGNAGKYISMFESNFAHYCGVRHGISTNNGTTALHVAMAALGLTGGDEVLVQTLTNMATVFAVCYTGAKPVAIDIEPDTWNIAPTLIESKITPRTKAIVVVHLFGHPVDMDPIMSIARKHNLLVIEDCAQAHGAEYKGKRVGSIGDIACFSFYANKIITTGEGGMVVTNSDALAEKVRSLHSLSYGCSQNKFMHEAIGFNYRMSNVLAAIGCAQLDKISSIIKLKRKMASIYKSEFAGLHNLQLPVECGYANNVYWMYHVVLRDRFNGRRKEIMNLLRDKGIETRESFVPFNQQEIFIKDKTVCADDCPVANYVGDNGFYLPSGPIFEPGEQEYVVEVVKSILQ